MDPTKTLTVTADGATLSFFPLGREVRIDGHLVDLTPTEYALLQALVREPDRVYLRDELNQALWNGGYIGTRNLSAVASRLHRKLDRRFVKTVWGVGYRLTLPAQSVDSGR